MAQAFRTQNLRLLGNLFDKNDSLGAKGYSLSSVGNGVEWRANPNENSGIISGGVLSATIGGTTFNVSAGVGQIVSNSLVSGEVIATNTRVSWSTQNNITLTYRTSHQFSYIYVDENGVVQQQNITFTDAEYKNKIVLGVICHIDQSTINLVTNRQNIAYGDSHRLYELVNSFGPIKRSGLTVSAYSTNLTIARAAGSVFSIGCNYASDQFDADSPNINAASPASLCRVHQNSGGNFVFDTNSGSYYTDIDPTKYNNGGGTLQTVNNNQWSTQRLFFFPNNPNDIIAYYGRAVYNSYNDAVGALSTETFSEATITAENAVFLGYLVLRGGATNLSTSSDGVFFQSGAFRNAGSGGGGGGGGGGGSTSYLDDLLDVAITSPSDSQFLIYDNGTSLWKNASLLGTAPITFTGVGTSLAISLDNLGVTSGKLAEDSVITSKILNSNVTYAKIQNVSATSRVLGRISSGSGSIEELNGANIATIIGSNPIENAVFTSNLSGGIAGTIPYQSDVNTTSFTDAGSSGQILLSAASGKPTWSAIKITDSGLNISDSNGNQLIKFPAAAVANAINEITISNAAASNSPSISATGDDTNLNLKLYSKGSGKILINDKAISLDNSFITSGNYSLTLTTTGATDVTLPTTGTLATTSDIKDATLTIAANSPLSVGVANTFTANASSNQTITISVATASISSAGVISTGAQSFAGSKTFTGQVTIEGNLTVNGTTSTINSNTLSVDDKNIELGSVSAITGLSTTVDLVAGSGSVNTTSTTGLIPGQTVTKVSGAGDFGVNAVITSINSETQFTVSPVHVTNGAVVFNVGGATDDTANGGGITLKSSANKTLTWVKSSASWTSSENFDLANTKTYKINSVDVLSATTLGSLVVNSSLTSVGTLTSLTVGGLTNTDTLKISNAPALSSAATLFFASDNGDVKTRTAAQVRSDIGAGTGNGSVTSVSGAGTVNGLTLTGTVTTTGSLTLGGTLSISGSDFGSQTANKFLAAPNGSNGNPTFRTIAVADVPTLNQDTNGTAALAVAVVGSIAGTVLWQSGANATSFTAAGSVGQVLLSGGANSPTWANQNSLNVNSTANVSITTDDATNASYYLYFGSAISGDAALKASTKIRYNPSSGAFSATTKSFRIPHPIKSGYDLVYGSLESPYHGIRLTGKGKTKGNRAEIILPDYIKVLIDESTINIQLTVIKSAKILYVSDIFINDNKIIVKYDKCWYKKNKDVEFFWDFTAERKDVPKLIVEEKL